MHAFTKAALLSTSLTIPTSALAQDVQGAYQFSMPPAMDTTQVMGTLIIGCETFDTDEQKVTCSKAIANAVGNYAQASLQSTFMGELPRPELMEKNCINVDSDQIEAVRSDDPDTSITAMNLYVENCLHNGITMQESCVGLTDGDICIGAKTFSYNPQTAVVIDYFRIAAAGIQGVAFENDFLNELTELRMATGTTFEPHYPEIDRAPANTPD